MTPEEKRALEALFQNILENRLPEIVRVELAGVVSENRYLKQDEAADYMNISRSKLYHLQSAGIVPFGTWGPNETQRITDRHIVDKIYFKFLNDPRQLVKRKRK